jgi:hypothetical protein
MMLRSLLSPPLLLLLLVLLFPSGNSAIDVVKRIMLASGLGETSEFITRLSEAYAYTNKEVHIQYTATSGAEFTLNLFKTGHSDIAILPSTSPSDSIVPPGRKFHWPSMALLASTTPTHHRHPTLASSASSCSTVRPPSASGAVPSHHGNPRP